jgi:hypothetical protein
VAHYLSLLMAKPKKDVYLHIRIGIDIKSALQVLADKDERILSDYIRRELEKLIRQNPTGIESITLQDGIQESENDG